MRSIYLLVWIFTDRFSSANTFEIAYLVQSSSCIDISDFLSDRSVVLLLIWGNLSLSCEGAIFYPNSTRSQGWNRLYSDFVVRYYTAYIPARHRFDYIVLVDGDAKLDLANQFETEEKQPWRVLERYLFDHQPLVCSPVGVNVYHDKDQYQYPDLHQADAIDDVVLAMHAKAAQLLLPLAERFDDNIATSILGVFATAYFSGQVMKIKSLVISNAPNGSASNDPSKLWIRQWISSSLYELEHGITNKGLDEDSRALKEHQIRHASAEGKEPRIRQASTDGGDILLHFESCHPYFYDRSQFYRELRHYIPDYMPPINDFAREDSYQDCRDLLSEDDRSLIPDLNIGCNMSEVFRDPARVAERVAWTREEVSGSFEWRISITGCDLSKISHSAAKQCISRSSPRGVMFIGDSLARYQYLNLAHFIATGNWHSPADLPNENEKKFGDWASFYKETNRRLRGLEICDCYRNASDGNFYNVTENRYFEEPGGVKLTFFLVLGERPFRQHALARLNVTCNGDFPGRYASLGRFARRALPCAQAGCAPGLCSARPKEEADPAEFMQYLGDGSSAPAGAIAPLVLALLPSDVVVNAGLHWRAGSASRFATDAVRLQLQGEADSLRRAGAEARLHWKTTTALRDWGPYHGGPAEYPFAAKLVEAGAFQGVYDAWALTHSLALSLEEAESAEEGYWDALHFHGPIYSQLNRVLIAYLCSLPPGPRLVRLRDRGADA
jgi:hypothetical protein